MILAFSTGVDSFVNPGELGPLYPFVGAEWVFVVIAFVLWLLWHVGQIRSETKEQQEACRRYDEIGLDRAMYHGGSALIATDEEWADVQAGRRAAARRAVDDPVAGGTGPTGGTAPPPPPGGTLPPEPPRRS